MKTNDWKKELSATKNDMHSRMTPQEIEQEKKQQKRKEYERREFYKRVPALYEFLAWYKQNSGILINNFFRKRDFKTYLIDKFHCFDFDVTGIFPPNYFDNLLLSMSMVKYLEGLEERKIAYYPINQVFMRSIINLAEAFDFAPPLEEDTILYRGCTTLERNGVAGIVSTTTDFKIAEQFSRGTILTIHVPSGTRCINIKSIRPKEQRKKDYENEILLPPCSYEIINEKEVLKGREPNNLTGKTKKIEIKVKSLDLLEEFYDIMLNPPEEYEFVHFNQEPYSYEEALMMIEEKLQERKPNKRLEKKNIF